MTKTIWLTPKLLVRRCLFPRSSDTAYYCRSEAQLRDAISAELLTGSTYADVPAVHKKYVDEEINKVLSNESCEILGGDSFYLFDLAEDGLKIMTNAPARATPVPGMSKSLAFLAGINELSDDLKRARDKANETRPASLCPVPSDEDRPPLSPTQALRALVDELQTELHEPFGDDLNGAIDEAVRALKSHESHESPSAQVDELHAIINEGKRQWDELANVLRASGDDVDEVMEHARQYREFWDHHNRKDDEAPKVRIRGNPNKPGDTKFIGLTRWMGGGRLVFRESAISAMGDHATMNDVRFVRIDGDEEPYLVRETMEEIEAIITAM
ncbi:hypothetical protein PLUTO_00740 [Luteibacter phage vB_LflM-Pluto]|uniref:Uncharacterized protein n=1 Tax=Luteibacter phage vB_LflM-Pluto TaxID=2948611 RepID=A0A9E7SLT4_9CAUD|nr:hypothetical protein PLUTO_00740 [Luteibacter phage vB_LflM-Pluto]